jgi:hypothetical protein
MKKFFLALSILSVVPYSTTSCSQNDNGGIGVGGVILLCAGTLVVGKYVGPYVYNYIYPTTTPADQTQQQSGNNSSELPKTQLVEKETPFNQPLSFEDKGSQNDAPKHELLERKKESKPQQITQQRKPYSNDTTKGTQPKPYSAEATKGGAPKHTQKPVDQVLVTKTGESNPDFWNAAEMHLRKSVRQSQTEKFKKDPFNAIFD